MGPKSPQSLFVRGSWSEVSRVSELLRRETTGGALLLAAALVALVWANSSWSQSYAAVRDAELGPAALHLRLSVGEWAADGLLAFFFFVAGLELKREFVAGDLRDPRRAVLPVAAAVGGMVVPATIFVIINWSAGREALRGWAVPVATDIAFALAVLAIVSTHLPAALRTFLLTLAVVDDLLAIAIIAGFYTDDLHAVFLAAAIVPLALFGVLVQLRIRFWWLLVPSAVTTWGLVHASGVHATVAGVLLALTVPVLRSERLQRREVGAGLAEHLEHRLRPLSAVVAVPIFALFAAGVSVGGLDGFGAALTDRVALGVVAGLIVGKSVGILGSAFIVARFTRARLDDELRWVDVFGMAMLGGIGFTVSLLIGDLAFGADPARSESVKVGVLVGSLLAGLLAAILLRARNRAYRRMCTAEETDTDQDGTPDVYESLELGTPRGDEAARPGPQGPP